HGIPVPKTLSTARRATFVETCEHVDLSGKERHTERMPPPVGTRGVLGTHRRGLRGAGGVALRG
ncbi:hypothetical protein ACFV2E_36855, partial [Streptomyces globisporus]|uniref:hypothetical protein n=1 Tax=Streptomyces globisporus TaxID=1908 RepID=UPI0036BC8B42